MYWSVIKEDDDFGTGNHEQTDGVLGWVYIGCWDICIQWSSME